MRVLMVTDLIWPDPGGRSEKMVRHLKALDKDGFNVDVLCPATQTAGGNYCFLGSKGIVYRVQAVLWAHLRSLKWQESFLPISQTGKNYLKIGLPGGYMRWFVPAMYFCWKKLKKKKYDALLCVSNPITTQLVGLAVARFFPSVKLVCELRDPLVGYYRSRHSKYVNQKVESWIAKWASLIVEWEDFNPVSFLDKGYDICGSYLRIKSVGYEPDDFSGYKKEITYGEKLKLVYTGNYYGERMAWRAVVRGIDKFVKSGGCVSLEYYGYWDNEQKNILLEECGSKTEWLTLHGFVSKEKCIRALEACHGLIYILEENEESKSRVSSKLYDYIGAQRPILALVPKKSRAEEKLKNYCPEGLVNISPVPEEASLVVLSRFEEALAGIYCKFRERKLEDVVKPMAEEYSCRAGEKEFCMGIKTVFEKYNVKE